MTTSEKNTCSVCGEYKGIVAKLVTKEETLYCKECNEKHMEMLSKNFNKIKFYCVNCSSSDLTQGNPKTGIDLTDVPSVVYANALLTCNACHHNVFVKMEDRGKVQ